MTLITLSAIVLALTVATNYTEALFIPVVIAVAVLAVWHVQGRAAGLISGGLLALGAGLLLGGAYRLGGPAYAQGISFISHFTGSESAGPILSASVRWGGITAVLALAGAFIYTLARQGAATTMLAWVLAGAWFLAPADHVRIRTQVSLFEHVGIGLWFASAIAGCAVAALPRIARAARARRALGVGLAVTAVVTVLGFVSAGQYYRGWSNSSRLTAELSRFMTPHGTYLAEDDDVPGYYFENTVTYTQWNNTYYMAYLVPKTGKYIFGVPGFAAAIQHRYFNAIVLDFGDTAATDQAIVADIKRYGDYRLDAVIHYQDSQGSGTYRIWVPVAR